MSSRTDAMGSHDHSSGTTPQQCGEANLPNREMTVAHSLLQLGVESPWYISIGETEPLEHTRRWSVLFFMESEPLLLTIFVTARCIGVYSHALHPAVDPLSSKAPSASDLGGGDPSALGKPVYQILAQLKVLSDLLERHPSVLHIHAY